MTKGRSNGIRYGKADLSLGERPGLMEAIIAIILNNPYFVKCSWLTII